MKCDMLQLRSAMCWLLTETFCMHAGQPQIVSYIAQPYHCSDSRSHLQGRPLEHAELRS